MKTFKETVLENGDVVKVGNLTGIYLVVLDDNHRMGVWTDGKGNVFRRYTAVQMDGLAHHVVKPGFYELEIGPDDDVSMVEHLSRATTETAVEIAKNKKNWEEGQRVAGYGEDEPACRKQYAVMSYNPFSTKVACIRVWADFEIAKNDAVEMSKQDDNVKFFVQEITGPWQNGKLQVFE